MREGYPNVLSAQDLIDEHEIADSSAYELVAGLAKEGIVHAIWRRNIGSKREVKKYYFEDYNYIYNQKEGFKRPFAPGYVEYEETFLSTYNKRDKKLEESILGRLVEFIADIYEQSDIKAKPHNLGEDTRTGKPHGCGYDHEARDFIRASLLRLIDELEFDARFIEFLRRKGIISEDRHKDLLNIIEEREVQGMADVRSSEPLKQSSNAKIVRKLFFGGERIEYKKLAEVGPILLQKIFKLNPDGYEKVVKYYAFDLGKHIAKDPRKFDSKARELPNGYWIRLKTNEERAWKVFEDWVTRAGFPASYWKVE